MKSLVYILFLFISATSSISSGSASDDKELNPSNLILKFPFDAKTKAVCTYSGGTNKHSGTHKVSNSYWAVDLATPYDLPSANVIASADGIAFVLQDKNGNPCKMDAGTPRSAPKTDCGNGWGNRVKILHSNGYFSLYTHLEKVLIKNGAKVKQGQVIGVEGWTGYAGHRHLHWGLQKLNCSNEQECVSQLKNLPGESIPFTFVANRDGIERRFNTKTLNCSDADPTIGTITLSGTE